MSVCNSNNNCYDIHSVLCFLNFLTILILCFNSIIAHLCVNQPLLYFSLPNTSLKVDKKDEKCSSFTICLYITIFNYSAVVGIYMVNTVFLRQIQLPNKSHQNDLTWFLLQRCKLCWRFSCMVFPTLNKHNSFVYVTNTRLSCSFDCLLAITLIPLIIL